MGLTPMRSLRQIDSTAAEAAACLSITVGDVRARLRERQRA